MPVDGLLSCFTCVIVHVNWKSHFCKLMAFFCAFQSCHIYVTNIQRSCISSLKPTKKVRDTTSCVSSRPIFVWLFKKFQFLLFYALLTSVKLFVGVFCIRIFVTLVFVCYILHRGNKTDWSRLTFLCVRRPSNAPPSVHCLVNCYFVQYGFDFHVVQPCLTAFYRYEASCHVWLHLDNFNKQREHISPFWICRI